MTLNDQFGFERIQRRIDDPHNKAVIVIIVNDDDSIDSASAGIDNAIGMWSILFSMTAQLSDEVIGGLSDEQKAGVRLVVPTAEQARDLGILKPFKRRR